MGKGKRLKRKQKRLMPQRRGCRMIPDWILQILLLAVSIIAGGALFYFISQKQYYQTLWSGTVAAIILIIVIALFIRNEIVKKEIGFIKNKAPQLANSIDKASRKKSPINFKTVQPAQFLPDNQGGVYIVMPDILITNTDNVAAMVNVELRIERNTGCWDSFEPSAARIQTIELWLDSHHSANSNFMGRQINVPPNSGINGYMCFYVDKFHLDMSSITIDRLPYLPYLFHIEQTGLKPRDISSGEAIIGHEVKNLK
jgi:hypothetical protein